MTKGFFCICLLCVLINLSAQENTVPGISGNRYIEGGIDLENAKHVSVELPASPKWIVGHGKDDSSIWHVLLGDGSVYLISISKDGTADAVPAPDTFSFPADTILSLDSRTGDLKLFPPGYYRDNYQSHPVSDRQHRTVATIEKSGDLVITGVEDTFELPVRALTDGRLVLNRDGRFLMLTNPSSRYPHGILGDRTEATGFTVVETDPIPNLVHEYRLSGDDVFETLVPMWADIDSDGKEEIVLTKSNARSGSRLQIYADDGKLIGESDPIGLGFRWRHVIAAGPMGPDGEIEIAVVRTPHIGGILEFYRLYGRKLEIEYLLAGYSTHQIGSRNLDSGPAGDFNRDGRMEIMVPSQDNTRVDCVKRTIQGSEIIFSDELNGRLSTNIAACNVEENIHLALGTDRRRLVIYVEPE